MDDPRRRALSRSSRMELVAVCMAVQTGSLERPIGTRRHDLDRGCRVAAILSLNNPERVNPDSDLVEVHQGLSCRSRRPSDRTHSTRSLSGVPSRLPAPAALELQSLE